MDQEAATAPVPVAGNTGDAPSRTRRLAVPAALTLVSFVALAVLLYFVSAHTVPGNSDGATVILEGQSMSAGHLLLHGWALSLDSFWTVDAVVYMFAVLFAGVHAAFLNLVPTLVASAVIVTGVYFVRADWRGVPGFAGSATVVALLALPSFALAFFFLQGPLHVGTALLCLLAFAGLRNGRFGWRWVVVVGLLAAGCLGDLQTVALGIVPALLAGAVAAARCRDWKAGLPTSSAAVASVVLAIVGREIARAIGTFVLISSAPRQPISQMINNLGVLRDYLPKMLGVGTAGFGSGGAPHFTEFAHLVGLIAVAAGVFVSADRPSRRCSEEVVTTPPPARPTGASTICSFSRSSAPSPSSSPSPCPPTRRLRATSPPASSSARSSRAGSSPVPPCCSTAPRRSCAGGVCGSLRPSESRSSASWRSASGKHREPQSPFQRYDEVGAFLERHGLHDGVGDYFERLDRHRRDERKRRGPPRDPRCQWPPRALRRSDRGAGRRQGSTSSSSTRCIPSAMSTSERRSPDIRPAQLARQDRPR